MRHKGIMGIILGICLTSFFLAGCGMPQGTPQKDERPVIKLGSDRLPRACQKGRAGEIEYGRPCQRFAKANRFWCHSFKRFAGFSVEKILISLAMLNA